MKRPIVIIGPSGAGKGTLTSFLLLNYPLLFKKKISTTTRTPRDREVDGVHYHFLTEEAFATAEENGEFVETSVINGNRYGTTYKAILEASDTTGVPLLELDVNVVLDAVPKLNAICIWIGVPDETVLRERLIERGTETMEQIEVRMETTKKEIAFFEENKDVFDFVLVNDNLANACWELKEFLLGSPRLGEPSP